MLSTGSAASLLQTPRSLVPALVALVLAALMLTGCGYRDAPTLEERAQAAWGEMQGHCRRRAELAVALTEAMTPLLAEPGHAHLRDLASPLADLRERVSHVRAVHDRLSPGTLTDPAGFRQFEEAENAVSASLERLKLAVDRHVEARGQPRVLALKTELDALDSRITLARRDYVEAVRAFNTEIRTFPGMIWARLVWGSRPLESFAPAAARPVVTPAAS
jgi:LemA protein